MNISGYKICPDLAMETGIHIGDGSMNIYNNQYFYTVACHASDDREFMDQVVLPLIKRLYGKTPKPRNWSQGTYGFRICSKKIIMFKYYDLGLPLGKKIDAKIPLEILNRKDLFINFLKGYFATDGCLTYFTNNRKLYPRLFMVSISKDIILQVRKRLENLGFRVTYWIAKPPNPNWNIVYKICINGFPMLSKWNSLIGFINPKNQRKYEKFIKTYINSV